MSARVRTIEIVDMQRNGYSNEDIAKHFGITREEVKEKLTRYDKQTKYYKFYVEEEPECRKGNTTRRL